MADFDNSFLSEQDTTSAHEDALVFEIEGQPIGWRASGLALKRAADAGLEAGRLLYDLQKLFTADVDEEDLEEMTEEEIEEELSMSGGMADMMDVVAKLTWVGALHFEPNAKQEVILSILDTSNVGEVPVGDMLTRIFPALEEDDTAGKATEEAEETSES